MKHKYIKKFFLIAALIQAFIFITFSGYAQLNTPGSILIQGAVLGVGDMATLPHVHVTTQGKMATITDAKGYFSIRVNPLDTLTFTYVGYKKYSVVVPDTLSQKFYVAGVVLNKDTVHLSEVVITPWMNKEQFKEAFKNNRPDESTQKVNSNMELVVFQARSITAGNTHEPIIDNTIEKQNVTVKNRGMLTPNEVVTINGLVKWIKLVSQKP